MKRLLTVIIFFAWIDLAAQPGINPDEYSLTWNKGYVVFASGDTLHCDLRFYQAISDGTLQVMDEHHTLTLSPSDVVEFMFYDENKSRIRKFSTMAVERSISRKVFLENLYDDARFSILRQRTIDVPYEYMNVSRFISKAARISRKYILDTHTGVLLPLSKENMLRLLEDRQKEIAAFISHHHIRFRKVTDYVNLLQFHSSL